MYEDEQSQYDGLDPEGPSAEDLEYFNRTEETQHGAGIRCQECREFIYDDTDICPHCGAFQLPSLRPRRRPMWVVLLAIIALVAFVIVYTI